MAATVMRDVLQRRLPWWVALPLSASSAGTSGGLFLTFAQRRQLFTISVSNRESDTGLGYCIADMSPCSAQSMLTHGRFFRVVDLNRGDVLQHVDTSDFLSWEGLTLTTVPEEIDSLEARTRRNALTLPFWVTEPQAMQLCSYESVNALFNCAASDSATVSDAFHNRDTFVELAGGTSELVRYVNWGALCSGVHNLAFLRSCLSFFRCFFPINVRTKHRFDTVIEIRLRVEAMNSGCWCSIWGTTEDYEKCGFSVLEGALGVDVFDELGNPAFLIHALCTSSPLEVYAACYPNDSISAVLSS
ncbi:hypothetical protein ABL78_3210 [Leptomonas seymouri]|uniref:Trypanosoma Tc-38 (p38) protein domain-containing protein n=1 Tax=Leptomonas seymouri TaxID=5684 RepID=A0A0N0P6Z2_LEPSE|nr:hypothetical protein ABL78_3210 [Leptomonas seymouri]|eukprot:KPI87737.1 hypothetical protein ABL78_3210 [Leptomonas seymouri]